MEATKTTKCVCCWKDKGTDHHLDCVSHYQELSVSKGDNTYQTLTLK